MILAVHVSARVGKLSANEVLSIAILVFHMTENGCLACVQTIDYFPLARTSNIPITCTPPRAFSQSDPD